MSSSRSVQWPPAPIRLLPQAQRSGPDLSPWPSLLVPVWHVLLRVVAGEWGLRPTPSGIHSVVSAWLHRAHPGGVGEPHGEEHRYSVLWQQVSDSLIKIELRLFDDSLTPVLLDRAGVGSTARLGRVGLQVIALEEVQVVDLAAFAGVPSRGWRLRFRDGITFKRGDAFMPWPAPVAVLGSIQRRLALAYGWGPERERLPREVSNSVMPVDVDLQTIRWPEGDGRRSRARDVAVAVGEVEWICTGPPDVSAYVDRLIQAGQLTSAGAKTAWGAGVIRVLRRTPVRERRVDQR